MINVRKLKLVIRETDKELRSQKYKFIRDSQYAQYRALNVAMGYISSAYLKANKDIKSEEYKEAIKLLTNSNPIFNGIEVGTGIDTLSAVTRKVKKDFSASIKNGLMQVKWPGRFEKMLEHPPSFIDGAHNVDGIKALAETLNKLPKRKTIALVGILKDKEVEQMVSIIGPCIEQFVVTKPLNPLNNIRII